LAEAVEVCQQDSVLVAADVEEALAVEEMASPFQQIHRCEKRPVGGMG
jgi:hypothetical protein